MIKKRTLFFILAIFLMTIAGCETVKGSVKGLVAGATEGAKKDWQQFQQSDEWMRKHLW
jgi:hypothetical protein